MEVNGRNRDMRLDVIPARRGLRRGPPSRTECAPRTALGSVVGVTLRAASELRGNNLQDFEDVYLNAKARDEICAGKQR